jgi:branched-chain amino acid transport system ATP-binding protein
VILGGFPVAADVPALAFDAVSVKFGGVIALEGLSFLLAKGEALGLIGPNGAGKTTAFNCLSGLGRPWSGEIRLDGRAISREAPHKIADLGIGRTFQHSALFTDMTVRENLLAGFHRRFSCSALSDAMRTSASREADRRTRDGANELIETFALGPVADRKVKSLPFGLRKRVELARTMATAPRVLLLDEPACGLNGEEMADLVHLIVDLRKRHDVSLLLIEHNMGMMSVIAERALALNFGKKIAEGRPTEVLRDPVVVESYLGGTLQ